MTYGLGGKGGFVFFMLRDSSKHLQLAYEGTEITQLLSLWVQGRGPLYDVSFGGWPYQSKKECKKCGSVSACKDTHRQRYPHTRTETEDFLYYCSLLHILEFLNFLWGKKGLETIKCFEEMKSTKTYFVFLFLFCPLHRQCPLFNS